MSGFGSLREYGILKEGTRISQPGGGGTTTYAQVWEGWGHLTNDNSAKQLQADQTIIQDRKRWKMRWQSDLSPSQGWILEHEGNVYQVTGVVNIQERERYWMLDLILNRA